MKRLWMCLVVLLTLVFVYSCRNDDLINNDDFTPSLIVDGSIESGDYARVFLTFNIPYYVNIDSASIIHLVVRQAKVSVSDGTKTEVLTLTYDKTYFPPYYYQGNEIVGEVGKAYYLTIEYGVTTLTATTTIPAVVKPDSAWFVPNADAPEKGVIYAKIKDPVDTNFYRMYTRVEHRQDVFAPTLISNFDDKMFNGKDFIFHLNKGPVSYLDIYSNYYFAATDTVMLKVCTLDRDCFKFWSSYQKETTNGANPIASSYHTMPTNIVGGGLGYWSGFGVNYTEIMPTKKASH